MIPFVNLVAQRKAYISEFEQAECTVLNGGCYVGGPVIAAFERKLADFCNTKHAVSCGSGTEALSIALMALGIKPGDEVIVPDFTFIAPAECVAILGGVPRFADIDPETLQISPKDVEPLINENTRGIIAVDLFGQCAPFEELRNIANKHGLWILEDAAQAFGARQSINGQEHRACTFGDISITSFYPSKPLGCYGDGGALFTKNDEYAERIRQIANHGSKSHYHHETIGINSRLDSIQAAILDVKLNHFEDELKIRQENARKYNEFFAAYKGFTPQKISNQNESTYAQYTLLVDNRDEFIEKLKAIDIPYCIHYPMALHQQPCFNKLSPIAKKTSIGSEENSSNKTKNCADCISQKVVSLPVCAFTDVDSIISKMKSVL